MHSTWIQRNERELAIQLRYEWEGQWGLTFVLAGRRPDWIRGFFQSGYSEGFRMGPLSAAAADEDHTGPGVERRLL